MPEPTPPMPDSASRPRGRWAAPVPGLRRLGRWFRHCPRAVRVGFVLALVGGVGAGVAYSQSYLKKRAQEREVAAGWEEFEEAARGGDLPGMDSALDRVLVAHPDNTLAHARKAALAAGAAAPDDPELALVLVEHHLRHDRLAETAREAGKALSRHPKHWRSLCVLAHHALINHDPGEARRRLDQLPDPEDPAARLDLGGLLHAVRLSEEVGRDPAALRDLIVRRWLPVLRGAAQSAPPLGKVQLIECYLEPFADPRNFRELAGYWAAVARLADSAATEAAGGGDVIALIRLGELGPRLLGALARLRDSGWVPADRFALLVGEVENTTRRVWLAVRDRQPERPEAYRGLAQLAVRQGNIMFAVETLLQGLAACGDRDELLELLARLAIATGNPRVAFRVTWEAAERAGADPLKWRLAAGAALEGGCPSDCVLTACANARKGRPDDPSVCGIEARLWLDAGDPARALAVLRSPGGAALRSDPALARLHARALIGAGLSARVQEVLDELQRGDSRDRRAPPSIRVAFLHGVLDGKPGMAWARWAADRADQLLAEWPGDPAACRLLADALFLQSELSSPPWDPERGRAALAAYARLPVSARGEPPVIAAVAALQLKTLKDIPGATRTVAPLRDPGNLPLLTPGQREILGAVLVASGNPGDAVPVLERAVRCPRATAGCWVQLALAYHAEDRPAAARDALERAGAVLQRSSREAAEWRAAAHLIQAETP